MCSIAPATAASVSFLSCLNSSGATKTDVVSIVRASSFSCRSTTRSARRAGLNRFLLLLVRARYKFLVPGNLQVNQPSADAQHPESDERRNKKRAANRNVLVLNPSDGKDAPSVNVPFFRSEIWDLSFEITRPRSQISDLTSQNLGVPRLG